MTEEVVAALFMQIQLEYPFMSSVADSAIITNHDPPDEPILYCNDEFTQLTGYPKEEILGRNCRFLQGKHTDPKHVQRIRDAIREGTRLEIDLLNYRKDGTPFINRFCMLSLHEKGKHDGKIGFFLAGRSEERDGDWVGCPGGRCVSLVSAYTGSESVSVSDELLEQPIDLMLGQSGLHCKGHVIVAQLQQLVGHVKPVLHHPGCSPLLRRVRPDKHCKRDIATRRVELECQVAHMLALAMWRFLAQFRAPQVEKGLTQDRQRHCHVVGAPATAAAPRAATRASIAPSRATSSCGDAQQSPEARFAALTLLRSAQRIALP